MDKMQTDAQKLFEKGKIEESLNIYEKIIRGRFDHYPKKLVQYHFDSVEICKKLIQCTKSKSEFKEESNNENNLVNIQVSRDGPNQATIDSCDGEDTLRSKAQQVLSEDSKLLDHVIIEFNKAGMQMLSQGKLDSAKVILK